jgi:hypothetical protein
MLVGRCSWELSGRKLQRKIKKSQTLSEVAMGLWPGRWPTQGDEERLGPATALYETIALSFVHPERSRGICSSADPSWKCFSRERRSLPLCFVVPRVADQATCATNAA